MQQAGPLSPVDPEPDDSPAVGERRKGAPAPAPRPQRSQDPVVRWLTLGIFGVIIFWLVAMLSAAMFGLLTPAKAPRTAAERDLNSLTAQVQTGKASIRTYAQYVDTLIQAGQLVKAQSALDQSLQTAKTDRSYLLAEQAQLYLANKDYQGAVTAADKAIVEAQKELKAYKDANVANNRLPDAGAQMPTSYATAALAKADSLMQTKDYAAAVKAFDAYLTQEPTDADILVLRAQAKANAGDKTGAAADYRSALTYIPDYQPALDGLKQIGAAK